MVKKKSKPKNTIKKIAKSKLIFRIPKADNIANIAKLLGGIGLLGLAALLLKKQSKTKTQTKKHENPKSDKISHEEASKMLSDLMKEFEESDKMKEGLKKSEAAEMRRTKIKKEDEMIQSPIKTGNQKPQILNKMDIILTENSSPANAGYFFNQLDNNIHVVRKKSHPKSPREYTTGAKKDIWLLYRDRDLNRPKNITPESSEIYIERIKRRQEEKPSVKHENKRSPVKHENKRSPILTPMEKLFIEKSSPADIENFIKQLDINKPVVKNKSPPKSPIEYITKEDVWSRYGDEYLNRTKKDGWASHRDKHLNRTKNITQETPEAYAERIERRQEEKRKGKQRDYT